MNILTYTHHQSQGKFSGTYRKLMALFLALLILNYPNMAYSVTRQCIAAAQSNLKICLAATLVAAIAAGIATLKLCLIAGGSPFLCIPLAGASATVILTLGGLICRDNYKNELANCSKE